MILLRVIYKCRPQYNKGPRDWQNTCMFAITRYCYCDVLFHVFYYYWGKKYHLIHRRLKQIGAHYIEFHCFKSSNSDIKYLK